LFKNIESILLAQSKYYYRAYETE